MVKNNPIDPIAKRYYKIGLWLITAMALAVLIVMNVTGDMSLLNGLLVSVVFTFVTTIAYGMGWKAVAKSSPANLAKYYLAATAIRMFVALAVATVVIVLTGERQQSIRFSVIFIAFYLLMLVYDTVYFSRVEKNHQIN